MQNAHITQNNVFMLALALALALVHNMKLYDVGHVFFIILISSRLWANIYEWYELHRICNIILWHTYGKQTHSLRFSLGCIWYFVDYNLLYKYNFDYSKIELCICRCVWVMSHAKWKLKFKSFEFGNLIRLGFSFISIILSLVHCWKF